MNEHDHWFAVFRKVLDVRMTELLSKGLCIKVRQADPREENENVKQLWLK